jgi:hypothetical protein
MEEAQRFGDSAVRSQRPTRSGEDADAGIYWNVPGRANLLVFPGLSVIR